MIVVVNSDGPKAEVSACQDRNVRTAFRVLWNAGPPGSSKDVEFV